MERGEAAELLKKTGMIASLRGADRDRLAAAAQWLYEGGIHALEIPLNTVGAYYLIKDLRKQLPKKALIGAGAVLDAADAKAALEAGASFLFTPGIDKKVIRFGQDVKVPVYAGAATPTEVIKAWKYGAGGVRLFPAVSLGPGYAAELRHELGHIPLIAAGGIGRAQAAEYIRAGCAAVCLDCAAVTLGFSGADAVKLAAGLAEEIREALRPAEEEAPVGR
ncbi:bifunctional 4-hydroxy-2-oxoglutarate aldolase/2-dehydro-3-deoxy-phosphogluconate aldolase [Paenibacillus sp. YN15]|uniref:bifunctional 4-hydroxy-2-oxoglutarate aldolase/2-dehydro-3-deoxy-phosphogluconate aldolase n=1 Tax=Paenibacillus sp. YN15 TaxID=1742774 RepID=UPI0015EBE501|nr:bifunctional 4-hydroxy-2-oxoglutarate aldolase/2-dehydro-3-deoxy-phosphogluconate aldolase [Paenibacillus sp. YN15]